MREFFVLDEEPVSPPRSEEEEDDLLSVLEAMLFAAHEPLSSRRLAGALSGIEKARVEQALDVLRRRLDERQSPLQMVDLAGGWRLVTRPEYAPFLSRLFHKSERERLSAAAIETLAIVAYRQPVTRADIEGIRGVQAGPMLKALRDRKLIKVVGRAEVVGRPAQYGTTSRFLDHFGLGSLRQLPALFGDEQQFARIGDGADCAPEVDVDPDAIEDPFEAEENTSGEAVDSNGAEIGSAD